MNRGACHLSAWFRAHPQRGQPSCVGEEMDGSRTHRCHRRCGHGGQPPPARCCGRSCLWTTPWMARGQGRGAVGDGWSSPAPRCPAQSVHRFVLRHLWVTNHRNSGTSRSPADRRVLVSRWRGSDDPQCTDAGGEGVDDLREITGKLRLMSTHKTVHRLGTCGRRGWETDPGPWSRSGLCVTHSWGEVCGQLDMKGRHGGCDRVGSRRRGALEGESGGQPACCLMR